MSSGKTWAFRFMPNEESLPAHNIRTPRLPPDLEERRVAE